MKKYAVIVAAGSGSRMAASIPKQFLPLNGKPVLWYTLKTFLEAFDDLEIILVLHEDYLQTGKGIIQLTGFADRIKIITGGPTRFHSVKSGLTLVPHESIVFVHDGVRCLVSKDLIHRCYKTALETGNAIPAITSPDSIRIVEDNSNRIIDRTKVKLIQTPQTFQSTVLKTAFEQQYEESFTDEASVAEKFGVKITLVEGDETNIKITRPLDILLAEKILLNGS
jgi:2-C-methyl-D-erythritol 4-phosphate cytidylyltransferase